MAPIALLLPAGSDATAASSLSSHPTIRSVATTSSTIFHDTLHGAAQIARDLIRRQQRIAFIPANYPGQNDGPLPGNVVGIVLGSVAGFLLLMWLLYTCLNIGGSPARSSVDEIGVESLQRSTHHTHRTRSSRDSRRRSRSREEVIEVRSPPRRRERERIRETTVIREERQRSVPPPEEDIVEVIEEHSPPPRRQSRRVSSGYRNVDPDEFAGGDSPMRKVRR